MRYVTLRTVRPLDETLSQLRRVGEIQAWMETAGFAHSVCEMLQSDLVLATATTTLL